MTIRNLEFLLRPRSIAVIGASDREHTIGAVVMRNLLKGGFSGPILPVHFTRRSVAGVHAYSAVGLMPHAPDLAVICTPPDSVVDFVRSLGAHGTRAVVIATDGVAHEPVLAVAKPRLMRILGPNSMGLIVPALGINTSLAPTPAIAGSLAFVSQSGALLAAALEWATPRKIGFTHAVSLGDASDVDAADLLDFLGSDPATRAILLYIESVRNGRKFLSAARAAARSKPVIVMKSGRTPTGAEAVMRHTRAHPGDDSVFDAAIARAGMLRVHTMAALFEAAETLGRIRAKVQPSVAIITNSGGPGVIAADAIEAGGGELACAPIDLGADADPQRYADALRSTLSGSPERTVLLIHGSGGVVSDDAIAEACKSEARDSDRVLACWMSGGRTRRGASLLREEGVPVYETPEAAVQAYFDMLHFRRNQQALEEVPEFVSSDFEFDDQAVQTLLANVLGTGRERLTDPEGKSLLVAYGVPIVHTHVAANAEEAAKLAAEIRYPVDLKILSPDLEHRADVGGVALNIENEEELRTSVRAIERRMQALRPSARLAGFTVQKTIRPPGAVHRRHGARELTLRASADPIFGMVIRLDRTIGILPLNVALAASMLEHGNPDSPALATTLSRLSQLIAHHPEIVELKIDPLLVDEQGVMALEVSVCVARTKSKAGEHLAIRPYPRELEQLVALRDLRALLRPIRPEDARAYAEFIGKTDAPDLQFSFFSRVRRVSPQDLARYTQIDYDREMAFVAAIVDDAGTKSDIVGEARILVYPNGESAEFSILVRSDMQRRGLGEALVRKLIEYCRARGKSTLIGQIHPDNEAMIALARRCGMEVEIAPDSNLAVAHMDLQPRIPQVNLF